MSNRVLDFPRIDRHSPSLALPGLITSEGISYSRSSRFDLVRSLEAALFEVAFEHERQFMRLAIKGYRIFPC
jgi:hypothetical protein